MEKIVCDMCGKEIVPGNDEQGVPAGMGFQTFDGGIVNVCRACFVKRWHEIEFSRTNREDVVDR